MELRRKYIEKYNYYYDFSLFAYSAHSLKSTRKEQEANLAKKNSLGWAEVGTTPPTTCLLFIFFIVVFLVIKLVYCFPPPFLFCCTRRVVIIMSLVVVSIAD